jgi:hypothetical protein
MDPRPQHPAKHPFADCKTGKALSGPVPHTDRKGLAAPPQTAKRPSGKNLSQPWQQQEASRFQVAALPRRLGSHRG